MELSRSNFHKCIIATQVACNCNYYLFKVTLKIHQIYWCYSWVFLCVAELIASEMRTAWYKYMVYVNPLNEMFLVIAKLFFVSWLYNSIYFQTVKYISNTWSKNSLKKANNFQLVSTWSISLIKKDIQWYCMIFNVYFIQVAGAQRLDFKMEICQELVRLLCLFYILFLEHNYIYCLYLCYQQCPNQVLAAMLLTLTSNF